MHMQQTVYAVWDRSTRVFHWISVMCVLALAMLGLAILNEKYFGVGRDGKVMLKTLHAYVGYVFALNFGWRLLISLLFLLTQAVGGPILAGTDLYKPPFGGVFAEWVTDGDPERLSNLKPGYKDFVVQTSYDEIRNFRKPVVTIHMYIFYILMLLIFLHVLGINVGEFRERNGLVSAMITGNQVLAEAPVDTEGNRE